MTEAESRKNSSILEAASAERLGQRIHLLRKQHGLSLDSLAERSGVSRAMLSKIERGENNPTLIVVTKIALALGLTLSQLVGDAERQRVVTVPRSHQPIFRDPETGFERQMFPAFEGGQVELMRHIIPEGASSGDLAGHASDVAKYILMERGQLCVTIDGERYMLEEGDALYFSASAPHRYDNPGPGVCRYVLVMVAVDSYGR